MQIGKSIFLKDIIEDLVNNMNTKYNTDIAYYYGSPIETNFEHQNDKEDKVLLKYPFIALFLNGTDGSIDIESDVTSEYYGTANVWLIIMTEGNFKHKTIKETFDTKLTDVSEIYENLMNTIQRRIDLTIGEPENMKRIDHVKYGLIAKFNGSTSNVFSDTLTGIELEFKLPIIKQYEDC